MRQPLVVKKVGLAPRCFSISEKRAWLEFIETAPEGSLTRVDRPNIARAAICLARMEDGRATARDYARLFKILERYGMTPASRA